MVKTRTQRRADVASAVNPPLRAKRAQTPYARSGVVLVAPRAKTIKKQVYLTKKRSHSTSKRSQHSTNASRSKKSNSMHPLPPPPRIRISSYEKTSNLLQKRCPDPTNCISIGRHDKLMRFHFSNFKNFSFVDMPHVQKIGAESVNGFVLKMPFRRENYTAYTILKNSVNVGADNLMYEYKVGVEFINPVCKIYPCFTETYALCRYKSDVLYNRTRHKYTVDPTISIPSSFNDIIEPLGVDWKVACAQSKYICILAQYFDNVRSFNDFDNFSTNYNQYDLVSSLFYQVYFVLHQLKDVYTHYDLHGGNVLLYKPFRGNVYIEMHYHVEDGDNRFVVSFPTAFIAKIIDYGRNYFRTETTDSDKIVRQICQTSECDPDCGMYKGFQMIQGAYGKDTQPPNAQGQQPYADFFIDPTSANSSNDLGLLYDFGRYLNKERIQLPAEKIPGNGFKQEKDAFHRPLPGYPDPRMFRVSTVSDMKRVLEHKSKNWAPPLYDAYQSWTCAGDLHVYSNGSPYAYIERASTK